MPTREIAGLSPILKTVIDTATSFLGASGSGELSLKPDVAPKPTVTLNVGGGASLQLPSSLSIRYKKTGDSIAVEFVQPPLAVFRGISAPITKATIDLKQVDVSFGGFLGMFASITLKATS